MPFLLGEMPKGWLTCSKATPWLPSSPESQVLIWGAGTLDPPIPLPVPGTSLVDDKAGGSLVMGGSFRLLVAACTSLK